MNRRKVGIHVTSSYLAMSLSDATSDGRAGGGTGVDEVVGAGAGAGVDGAGVVGAVAVAAVVVVVV